MLHTRLTCLISRSAVLRPLCRTMALSSVDVRPEITLHRNNEVAARANFRFNYGPNEIDVGVADHTVRGSTLSANGLYFAIRNGHGLEFDYDVGTHSPRVRMKSSLMLADRLVSVDYAHSLKSNLAHLKLEHQMDSSNILKLDYITTGFEGFDSRNITLRWSRKEGKFIVEPSFNLRTETIGLTARYNVDDLNRITAHVDLGTNIGKLAWINRGDSGDLRITARAPLEKGCPTARPILTIAKTWTLDK